MRSVTAALGLIAYLFLADSVRGEDKPTPPPLLQLQDAVEAVIAEAEPSVACVIVSRSTEYEQWRAAPPNPAEGSLGRFNGDQIRQNLLPQRFGRDNKEDLNRLNAIDLAHPDHVPESYGTGIVLDAQGLILTNAHVVRNATKIFVRLPGGKGSYADIHASDPRSDLAVLKLLDPPGDLKPIKFGNGEKARKGQFVILVANPFAAGFHDGSPSASWGIISNLRRRSPGSRTEYDPARTALHHYGTLMQVDTRMNLGSSGGALLNIKGELIGVTTALAALSGVETPGGFAVPLDAGIRGVIEVLKRGEEVEYGFLGVGLPPTTTGPITGVQIDDPLTGTPAQRAGLARGDVILSINDAPIRTNDDLFLQAGVNLAGSTVRVEVVNLKGQKRQVSVKLAKYNVQGPIIASQRPAAKFGLRVDYTSLICQHGFRAPVPEGVLIREVLADSPAEKSQLQKDKIITRVNNRVVTTPAEYYQAMEKTGRSVQLTILDSDAREENITLENK
jgi:serine protease Do